MAATKGQAVVFDARRDLPTEREVKVSMSDMTFLALPMPLFTQLSDAAAKRQITLAQLLSTAVSDYLKNTEPTEAGKR